MKVQIKQGEHAGKHGRLKGILFSDGKKEALVETAEGTVQVPIDWVAVVKGVATIVQVLLEIIKVFKDKKQ